MGNPFLSAFVICGDSGLSTLGRALRSVVCRKRGEPLVDEVVIGWNGKDEAGLMAAIDELGRERNDSACPIHIRPFKWEGDFAKARNTTMAHCKGEWVFWFDSDDVVADADDLIGPDGLKAIEEVEKAYGMEVLTSGMASTTLRQMLKEVPPVVNAIQAPYDYAIIDGKVTIRQTMLRVIRLNVGWVWRSFSGVHEVLYPTASVGLNGVYTAGLLNRHYPPEVDTQRLARNADIVMKMEVPELAPQADARHAYDLATVQISLGSFEAADASMCMALAKSTNDEDTHRYLLVRFSLLAAMGKLQEALRCALTAIGIYPQRFEGYFAASEAYYLMGKPRSCVAEYERGAACKPSPTSLDIVLNRVVRSRANAAWSYCDLGEPEKGLPLAQEALIAFPTDALAQRVHERCLRDIARAKAMKGSLDLVEYYLAWGDYSNARVVLELLKDSVPLRGITSGVRFLTLERQANLQPPAYVVKKEIEGDEETCDRLAVYHPPGSQPVDLRKVVDECFNEMNLLVDFRKEAPNSSQLPGTHYLTESAADATPRFIFVAPPTGPQWNPTDTQKGLGGSESSFFYAARELHRLGHHVELFCFTPEAGFYEGVPYFPYQEFNEDEYGSETVILALRAPWLVRSPRLKARCFVWHQDNGYASQWAWGPEVAKALAGSLHVSNWQMEALAKELGPTLAGLHHVVGNGVDEDWVWALALPSKQPPRNPRKVVFASDPTRGLQALLAMWPEVRRRVPDAELHTYCSFEVAQLMALSNGASPASLESLKAQMASTEGVFNHGRVGQRALSEAMFSAGVYAYPGGPMYEGFGVALVQAQAAGLYVVAPHTGALPEVLSGAVFVPPITDEATAQHYLSTLCAVLFGEVPTLPPREKLSMAAWNAHGWPQVAERILNAINFDVKG